MRNRLSVSIVLVALCLVSGAANADWRFIHVLNWFVPEEDAEPHPEEGRLAIASNLPEGHFAILACACYHGNFAAKQRGKIIVTGEVIRAEGNETFRMRVRVRNGEGDNCVNLPGLGPDDIIRMDFDFQGFNDLTRIADDESDSFFFGSLLLGHMSGVPPTLAQARTMAREQMRRQLAGGAP